MAKKLPFLGALLLAALLMAYPAEAFEAAFQAICTWATGFAPSLLPFFMLIPALTCDEALSFYDKAFGRILPKAFAIPGRAASAVCVGLLAGSPAGALASARVINGGGFSKAEAKRLAIITSGLSPMFLISSVGVGLFQSRAAGIILARSNLLSIVSLAILCRFAFRGDEGAARRAVDAAGEGGAGAHSPVLQLAGVCGHMVLYAVIARMISSVTGMPGIIEPALGLFEIAGGLNAFSDIAMPANIRIALFSALCSFSGACVIAQNRRTLSSVDISGAEFVAMKILHALFSAGFALLQFSLGAPPKSAATPNALLPAIAAASLTLAVSVCVFFHIRKQRGRAPL